MDIISVILKAVIIVLVILLLVSAVYDISVVIYDSTLEYDTFSDTAVVCDKEYEDDYTTTTYVLIGKVTVPQLHHHDEEHNVYLMYEGEEYHFDNEDLYNQVDIGDEIPVLVHKGFNKNGELKNVYLSLEN